MTTLTWVAGTSGDWNSTTDWIPNGLPDSTATVILPDGSGSFDSKVGSGDNEIVNALTIGGFSGTAPTLEIAGTLQIGGSNPAITFVQGTILIDSTGLFEGAATSEFYSSPFSVTFVNNGTVRADGGSGTALQILTNFTNNGTLLADNGILSIGGESDANFVGTTLTGGTYIVEGPASGTFNEIEFGGNFNAVIASDAANIILDGAATDIDGSSGGSFQSLEQQLQTITSAGTLQLLDGRGYITTNAITDDGLLNLQGGTLNAGTLTVGGGGSLEGFGIVDSAVVDQSVNGIVASGGALDLAGGVSGTGALTTMAGSTLILSGDYTSEIATNNGVIYDTAGTLTIGSLSGNGTLVVQNGATLDLVGPAAETVVFSGSNATVYLEDPTAYTGTLSGFGPGDTLLINGLVDSAQVVNSDTLSVVTPSGTIDYLLSGNYTGATVSQTQPGIAAAIQITSGAPARSDFQFSISLDDTAGLTTTEENEIVNDLSAAADDWSQYVTGHAPLRIQLNIMDTSSAGSELANGGFTASVPNGEVIDGQTIYVPSSIYALTTGNYIPGTTADIVINLPLQAGELSAGGDLYVNPDPFVSGGTVPVGEFDLLTVFRHEMAHGLGFEGFTDPLTGALGADVTLFDHYIQDTIVSGTIIAANFVGPDAEAAYGVFLGTDVPTPVPLSLLNNGENFFHVANSSIDPLGRDLMSGVGLNSGMTRDISSVDLAMLEDVGLPVTAPVCYVRGTRIATPVGDVAIEELRVGDSVLTAGSAAVPIKWIGRRRVDCRRHMQPEQVFPVRICANAFAQGVPKRDLLVSPQHAIYAEAVLIPARCLINGRTVAQVESATVEYFHIELDSHNLLLAEGLPAESYLDVGDRGRFENGDAPLVLHPDFSSLAWEGSGCAELKVAGEEVQAVRWHLARRADVLAGAVERAA
ncbi:MAG TPA: Hint domain-containing protein [Acetobacteraceae bacterium]|jgi:hypothetical protein